MIFDTLKEVENKLDEALKLLEKEELQHSDMYQKVVSALENIIMERKSMEEFMNEVVLNETHLPDELEKEE